MSDFLTTLVSRQQEWLQAILVHLQLSLLSVLLAVLIALPLAVLLEKYQRAANWSLQLSGILQTIPSLALLGLLIPLVGIGKLPTIIALVAYAIFPILNSTYTGLREIAPSLEEAAEAFGMTSFEKLKKYRLALALPMIIAGIRTSTVMVIGTATLAALIGAGGLGSFILLGIDRNNSALILIGAFSSALLAMLAHYAISYLARLRLKTIGIIFVTALLLVLGSLAVGGTFFKSKQHDNTLIIAGKLGSEPDILINLYQQLIEANSDIKVVLKPNFGKTVFLYNALKRGDIDIYPEFSGTIVTTLLPNSGFAETEPNAVYQYAKTQIQQQDNLVYLLPMQFQNTYAVVVKNEYAQQHGLATISGLRKVEQSAVAGFTLEFNDREDGNQGLKSRYGLNLTVKTMEPALRYQSLLNNETQIADAYSTDSEIKQHHLTLLGDDRQLFPAYQAAPLLRAETLEKYPQLEAILNQLADKISEQQMIEMNFAVKVENQSAKAVARRYLLSHGLLQE
ncbi:ABC transporter permease/substrate-binding protein [Pasteurellaceae bacterium USgator11]|nr:ABC transporter permease/substrate-binding protein [Pasteurellaceae bacterium UScroc12]TNG97755.1 ABC transporter permease/substrate-binding protein [Pasteurellaceae bacterium USgator41]TNG99148.1 ABC transporter permease/substrate-binding protein [Pasteurellaceae bacterium UScroc31]TNH03049.1 ABC transporter permease/substrate-binding protein [Pasteurellaceae bacterium USgator11]